MPDGSSSIHILSRCGSDELGGTGLNAELFHQLRMLGGFLAEQRHLIEARRAIGTAPPFR